jgi:small-conductance mechanosensitive channel
MRAADVLILSGASFWHRYQHQLSALLTVVLTILAAMLVDRWIARRTDKWKLGPETATRVQFLRRLLTLAISLVGGLLALSQFGGLNQLATGVLASSAIVAAVVGFAARQTLANLIAGVMLTITQPLRIGDQVTVEGESGTIEDVRLNYTVLRTGEGRRVFIPNDRLASNVLRNDTIFDPLVRPEASVWIPLGSDADSAVQALAETEEGVVVRVAEVTVDGVRITLTAEPVPAGERFAREAELRLEGLRALRAAELLVHDER